MKNIAIFSNRIKDSQYFYTDKIMKYLTERGWNCLPDEAYCTDHSLCYSGNLERSDMAVVIGGDGTILNAASRCSAYGVPIVGVNIGKIGFLADINPLNFEEDFDLILGGAYEIEERMMLEVFENGVSRGSALNDIVFKHKHSRGVGKYKVFAGGLHLADYSADGVLIATPTGSTAYSLSVGGPIVSPLNELLILQPICPDSFHSRSIILRCGEVVEIFYENASTGIYLDGNDIHAKADSLTVTKSAKKVRFIKLEKYNFYKVLYEKIK
jgi:NAD+ kinase